MERFETKNPDSCIMNTDPQPATVCCENICKESVFKTAD
jgi:hypothetical protein